MLRSVYVVRKRVVRFQVNDRFCCVQMSHRYLGEKFGLRQTYCTGIIHCAIQYNIMEF